MWFVYVLNPLPKAENAVLPEKWDEGNELDMNGNEKPCILKVHLPKPWDEASLNLLMDTYPVPEGYVYVPKE